MSIGRLRVKLSLSPWKRHDGLHVVYVLLYDNSRRETRGYCERTGQRLGSNFKRYKGGQQLEPLRVRAGSSIQLAECPVQAYESFSGSSSKHKQ